VRLLLILLFSRIDNGKRPLTKFYNQMLLKDKLTVKTLGKEILVALAATIST